MCRDGLALGGCKQFLAFFKLSEKRPQPINLPLVHPPSLGVRYNLELIGCAARGLSGDIRDICNTGLRGPVGGIPRTGHDMTDALLAQNQLDAFDGIFFSVKKLANATKQIHILGPVIASAATALQGAQLGKFSFPESQNMLWHIEIICNFADGTKGLR